MIIQCEKCATRFKVADDKVTPQGIKVRCSKCQHVFTARSGDARATSGSRPTPSGIFAAPETRSSRSSSSGPPSSGSVSVPQASLARQDPSFDPFAPPPPTPSSLASSGSGGLSFSIEDGAPPGEDRSFFGAPNQTIGGPDDDDVPAPPPESPPAGLAAFAPEPPAPTPPSSADPFAASLHGGPSADPFSAPPSALGDPTAAFVDPFAAASGPSAPSALPTTGDPFGGPVLGDPFAGAPSPAGSFELAGADPFPGESSSSSSSSSSSAAPSLSEGAHDDPFAGLGVEVDDAYMPEEEEEPPPPPPAPVSKPAPTTPAPVVAKAEVAAPEASSSPKRRRGIPPAVPRVAWALAQACILVAFLTLSLVWVRGGSVDDIAAGNALEVVLGRASSHVEGQGGLRVEDVVVARRPVDAAPDLVVVSGYVVNGDVAQPAARVTVSFGAGAPAVSAWANAAVDGVDLVGAENAEALLALNERLPDEPALAPAARAPFVVLVRGAPDGAKADVKVTSASLPAAAVTPPPVDEGQGGKKLRRRPRKGQGGAGTRLDADAEPASARPKTRRASREPREQG